MGQVIFKKKFGNIRDLGYSKKDVGGTWSCMIYT